MGGCCHHKLCSKKIKIKNPTDGSKEKLGFAQTYVENSDFNRNDVARLVCCLGIVFLAECHDVDTLGSQGRSHRRCWGGLPGLQRKLNNSYHCNPQKKHTRRTPQQFHPICVSLGNKATILSLSLSLRHRIHPLNKPTARRRMIEKVAESTHLS